jgi:hypothetical protein
MEHRTIKWVERYASEVVVSVVLVSVEGVDVCLVGNDLKLDKKTINKNVTVYF